jgi:parvulin-like peptidyl-prolyl isomerase
LDDTAQKDVPREALAPLFDMKKGEVAVVSTKEGDVVIRVKDIIAGSSEEIEKRHSALKEKLNQEWVNGQIDDLISALRKATPAEIDHAAIDRLIGSDAAP